MNLSDLALDKQKAFYRFELVHPVTGEGLGTYMSVVGAQSDKARQFVDKQLRREHLRELENAKSRRPHIKTLAELQQESRELAISRLTAWENVQWENKPLEFNEENAELLLTHCHWIIDQILEHSNDLGKFLVN